MAGPVDAKRQDEDGSYVDEDEDREGHGLLLWLVYVPSSMNRSFEFVGEDLRSSWEFLRGSEETLRFPLDNEHLASR